mgnify:CR=1 FL=1
MQIITIISVCAALLTIYFTVLNLYRKVKNSWESLQRKIENLENALQVNQRAYTTKDILVYKDNTTLIKVEEDTEVIITSIDTDTNLANVSCYNGLLETKVSLEYLYITD